MSPPRLYPEHFRTHHKRQAPKRNRRIVEVPENVGPHVKLFFTEMRRQAVRYQEVEDSTGVRRATCKAWRRKNVPSLTSLQSAFALLGWDYVPVPALEVLPPDLAGELTALALKMQRDIPATYAAAVAVGVEQALLNMTVAEKRAVLQARTECACQAANDNIKPKSKVA